MTKSAILLLTSLLLSCTNKTEIDKISENRPQLKEFVDSLKQSKLLYKKCNECKLSGLEGNKIIGYSDRIPPKGNYYKKEVEIGDFEYDSYNIFTSNKDNNPKSKLFICYLNPAQKEKFRNFAKYYDNRISHYKQILKVNYVRNTSIITIEIVNI